MTTIAERIKENRKRSRPIESQPEDIIYQNQDQDSNLTPQQKGRIFEEQCQELIRSQGIKFTGYRESGANAESDSCCISKFSIRIPTRCAFHHPAHLK